MEKPTREQMALWVRYDAHTGEIVWVANRKVEKVGLSAITWGDGRYGRVAACGVRVYAHQVAVLFMTGEWPDEHTDHKDGNTRDNRWDNLRACSQKVNKQNWQGATSRSSTGLLGAYTHPTKGYQSTVRVEGKLKHLGFFDTAQEAHDAHMLARRIHYEGNTL
jgi:hypothetical protein